MLCSLAEPAVADGPLALHAPPLLVPEAAYGLGLAPEVAVKLTIDARGTVTSVQVLAITPTSEYDALFRDQVVGTLSAWRFAPATESGLAVPSTLDWRVRFPAKVRSEESLDAYSPLSPLIGADAEQRRAAILALPLAQRRRMLESETRAAIELLDPKLTREAATPRFVVRSDSDEERVAATVAGNLEAIFNVLAEELLPGIPLQAEAFKIQVVVYRSEAQYREFASTRVPLETSSGFYNPVGFIALHLERATSDGVLSTLLHEGTHAFLDRHIVRPGVALPRWLSEGFAEYVGNSAIQKGRLKPGRTFVHKYAFEGGQVMSQQTSAGGRLDEAREALRKGKGLGVQQMLEASPAIFYGDSSLLYYASAWLLVHHLRDGGAGWSTDRFPHLLLYLAEGYPQGAAFRTLYGDPVPSDVVFRQYVKSF